MSAVVSRDSVIKLLIVLIEQQLHSRWRKELGSLTWFLTEQLYQVTASWLNFQMG